ncbi:MAG: hypothetical protein K6F00_11135 [Lachnospiraceae bacterium]|nr:hypothetical protein [Lachnospiraceae bacterium]
MFKLRTVDSIGNEMYAPENNVIIGVQCNDPIIDIMENYVSDEDDLSLPDLIKVIKSDLESTEKRFLEDDLKRLFRELEISD